MDVENPNYYKHPSGIECIQVTGDLPFTLGNLVKYVWRWERKNGVEDLRKARVYLGMVTGDHLRAVHRIRSESHFHHAAGKVQETEPRHSLLAQAIDVVADASFGAYAYAWNSLHAMSEHLEDAIEDVEAERFSKMRRMSLGDYMEEHMQEDCD